MTAAAGTTARAGRFRRSPCRGGETEWASRPSARTTSPHSNEPGRRAAIAAARPATAGPLYVICQSGSRGRQACEKLLAAGLADVVNVEGGTRAWVESGLPINRGESAISLERQVRIAAGLLVLAGAVLGFFVDPYFIGLSAFVGAGLVLAGVTDTCGMGLLLTRMPWNRVAPSPATCVVARQVNEPTGGGS